MRKRMLRKVPAMLAALLVVLAVGFTGCDNPSGGGGRGVEEGLLS